MQHGLVEVLRVHAIRARSRAALHVVAVLTLLLPGCGGGNHGASTVTATASASSASGSTASTSDAAASGAAAATAQYVPLFAAGTPVMEQIQYIEADGTLVTRAGYRPTHRHARERGEYLYNGGDFDVASGPNPVDVGPGDYFNWP